MIHYLFLKALDKLPFWVKLLTVVAKNREHAVILEGHLTSLGKKRDRWCLYLPKEASDRLGKYTRFEVEFRPIGSIGKVRVRE